jgi:hypothetical protein
MVNGLAYDFESIKLMLPTGLTLGAESVEYGDEKGDEVVTGSNGLPFGAFYQAGFQGKQGGHEPYRVN